MCMFVLYWEFLIIIIIEKYVGICLQTNGGGQAEIIAERLEQGPFYNVHTVKDYAGITRFVKAIHA